MRLALAAHDRVSRDAVEACSGTVVKMMGDGMYAAFDDPLDAINAVVRLQQALAETAASESVALVVRCGLHLGMVERRDGDLSEPWSTGLRESWEWLTGVRCCCRNPSPHWSAIDCRRRLRCANSAESGYEVCRSRSRSTRLCTIVAHRFSGTARARRNAAQPAPADHVVPGAGRNKPRSCGRPISIGNAYGLRRSRQDAYAIEGVVIFCIPRCVMGRATEQAEVGAALGQMIHW